LRRGLARRGGADAEPVLRGDPSVAPAESTEPVLPVFGRNGGYRLVVRAACAEPLHRDMAHRYLVSPHLFRYLVDLLLLFLKQSEQVQLLVFGRGRPLRV
jgi:hypothetical protein